MAKLLQRVLPVVPKKVQHQRALPYADLPKFMKDLRKDTSISARALEFTILTAARNSEVREATWSEINLVEGVWIIPAERMKASRDHRVPLCGRALEILVEMEDLAFHRDTQSDYVFPGGRSGRPLSNTVMRMAIERLGKDDVAVPHGFRSTFRDWAAEVTTFQREVAEAALAHISGDKVERAYQRGDFYDKRKMLMTEWDRFATGRPLTNKATKKPPHARVSRAKARKPGKKG